MEINKIGDVEFEIPKSGRMNVPSRLFASEKLLKKIKQDRTLEQLRNMASLPGIQKYAVALPDAHQGYGFCIGGVAALSYENGGISPGGVGYDINCGVRLIRTNLTEDDVRPKIKELINTVYNNVPAGLGSGGEYRVSKNELLEVLAKGTKWAVKNGYGVKGDISHTEEEGCMKSADPNLISDKALKRGVPQLGSLGSGNHFLDIHVVDKVYNPNVAESFGIDKEKQICIMIHCGSRGLGHQVCSDYLRKMEKKYPELVKELPDRELVYAPSGSQMAEDYYKSMCAAANYAWVNRQMIMHSVRKSFEKVFDNDWKSMGMNLVYDICHNMAKVEKHDGVKCYVHRKGATRSFPKNHSLVPDAYKKVGMPVFIPGTLGTASYVLVGTEGAVEKTFGSTAHGSGRVMSRTKARKSWWGETLEKDMWNNKKIYIKTSSYKGLSEEAPGAYKDVDEVVNVSQKAGIGSKVVRLFPIGVING